MSVDHSILTALDTIYAAAADQSLWPKVIENILGLTDSQAASFCVLDGPTLPIFNYLNVETRSVDRDQFMKEYLQEGMAEHDPTVQYIVTHPGQSLVRDSAFISESEKDRHFYYDWHGRFSDTRHRMAGMANPAPGIQSGITVHRIRQKGDFETSHVEHFSFLLPHIERAVRIGFQLGTLGAMHQAGVDLLDGNSRAIVLLDRGGRVVFANRAARTLAAAKDGIALSSEALALQRPSDNRKLQRLIGAALEISADAPEAAAGVMRALRPSGKRPLAILVSPVSQSGPFMTMSRPAVCVVMTDPERRTMVPEFVLKTLFGLTSAETRLALKLAQGAALNESAAELGIAYTTARTQLAVIFRKTGTRRQGELVKLLLSDLPLL